MKHTSNIKLLKPDATDVYNIDHFNQNADILDNEVSNIKQLIGGADGDVIAEVKKSVRHIRDVKLSADGWEKDGEHYIYTYKHSLISRNTVVDVNFHLESINDAKGVITTRVNTPGEVEIIAIVKPTVILNCNMVLMTEVF